MKNAKPLPPLDYLRECFFYDPETGDLHWRKRPLNHFCDSGTCASWNARWAGTKAGKHSRQLNPSVSIDAVRFQPGRICWALHHGYLPPVDKFVAHLNEDQHDCRIENLALATPRECSQRVGGKRLKPGAIGVSRIKGSRKNPWRAYVYVGNRQVSLGCHPTMEEAAIARRASLRRMGLE